MEPTLDIEGFKKPLIQLGFEEQTCAHSDLDEVRNEHNRIINFLLDSLNPKRVFNSNTIDFPPLQYLIVGHLLNKVQRIIKTSYLEGYNRYYRDNYTFLECWERECVNKFMNKRDKLSEYVYDQKWKENFLSAVKSQNDILNSERLRIQVFNHTKLLKVYINAIITYDIPSIAGVEIQLKHIPTFSLTQHKYDYDPYDLIETIDDREEEGVLNFASSTHISALTNFYNMNCRSLVLWHDIETFDLTELERALVIREFFDINSYSKLVSFFFELRNHGLMQASDTEIDNLLRFILFPDMRQTKRFPSYILEDIPNIQILSRDFYNDLKAGLNLLYRHKVIDGSKTKMAKIICRAFPGKGMTVSSVKNALGLNYNKVKFQKLNKAALNASLV